MNPSQRGGRINYLEFPALDAAHSARFYMSAFGWHQRRTSGAAPMLADSSGRVSISFVSNRPPASDAGVLLYVLVDSVAATCRAVEAHGAEIVQAIGMEAPDITARFRDPGGNIVEIYQERPLQSRRNSAKGQASLTPASAVSLMVVVLVLATLLIGALWLYA